MEKLGYVILGLLAGPIVIGAAIGAWRGNVWKGAAWGAAGTVAVFGAMQLSIHADRTRAAALPVEPPLQSGQ